MSRVSPTGGLVVFDRGLTTDLLAATGAGTRDSAYTEASPLPGSPDVEPGTWRPYLTGAQSVDLTITTFRGAYAGRDGASVLYRLATDTNLSDYRSWQEPNLVTGWSAPADGWGASSAWTNFAAAVIDETQEIVITALEGGGVPPNYNAQTWIYNTRTDTWTTGYDWDAGALDGLQTPISMAYDRKTGRLLLWSGAESAGGLKSTAYYSTDKGVTWTRYSLGFAGMTASPAFVVPGGDLDWLGWADGDTYASSDRGITWSSIASSNNFPGQPVLGPAGYGIAAVEDGTDNLVFYALPSATGTPVKAATIDSARAYDSCWACADADGTIYVFGRGTTGAGKIDELEAFYSLDGGVSWVAYDVQVWNTGVVGIYFDPKVAVAANGSVYLVGTGVGSTSTDNTIQVVRLGGWAQVAHGVGVDEIHTRKARWAWGARKVNHLDHDALLYLPITGPPNIGWTAVGVTGTATVGGTTPGLELTTTVGQQQTYQYSSGKTNDFASIEFDVLLDAAGNTTLATLGTTGGGVMVSVYLSNGTYQYRTDIDIGSDGAQVRDGATIRATLSRTMSSGWTRFRVAARKGAVTVWYSTDNGLKWTRLANDVTISNGGATAVTTDKIVWGNFITRVGHSYWRMLGFATGADWLYSVDSMAEAGNTSADGVRGHQFGRPVPGRGWAYPLSEATSTSEDVGRLTGAGGPTYPGQAISVPAAHEYPIEALDPTLYPSPRRTWRSTDTASDVRLVYDHGANGETWHGGALALLVIGGTPRQWILEEDDGGAGWTTLGTLDLALGTGLKWVRTGRTVTPDTGTGTVARYIAEDELVGGTIDLDGKVRRIARNSGGFWRDTAVQQIRLTLDGIDGTESASGTSGVLCAPSGLLVVYPTALVARRYLRVRVASGQGTPEGYYSAGICAVGRVVGFGAEAGWTYSSAQTASRASATASDGVTSIRQLGPPRRIVQYSWPEGCMLLDLHGVAATTPDYVAIAGAVPIATREDVPLALPGLVEYALQSGEVPCVLVPTLPSSTSSVLDPARWIYGRATGDLTVASMSGTEGADELLSVTGLTIEEIR